MQSTVNYTYDGTWGDLLTGYGGKTITSDTIGNMTSDGTWSYSWEHGRELASMSNGSTTWSYTYDADGMRTKRTNGSTTYNYVYNGGSLVKMTAGGNTLHFAYEASGRPLAVIYNGTRYHYVTNLQGDVVQIRQGTTPVVNYTYDAWGNLLTISGDLASTLGTHNPLRYRGYVYDTETGLYYLQSRYYNPTLGRFLNADAFTSTGQGMLGNNMFAYCLNNPVLLADESGSASVVSYGDEIDILSDPTDDVTTGGCAGACLAGIAITAALSRADEDEMVLTLSKKQDSSARIYTVYFLYEAGDPNQNIIYVGRVKTVGFSSRMTYHRTMNRELRWYINGLTKEECRGLEQVGMAFFHTINRNNSVNNQIRGVSPNNPARSIYFEAAKTFWGLNGNAYDSFMPASYWANWAENEFLNGGT